MKRSLRSWPMIFCMFGFFNVGFSCSILGQKGMLLHVFQPNLKEAEPGWFQVVPGELWNLELEILLLQIWSGILGAAIERTLWNQFSFSPVLLTEFFFYIPGGEAFLPTVGSCEDVLWMKYRDVRDCVLWTTQDSLQLTWPLFSKRPSRRFWEGL